jgi:hypothetical protein
MPEFIFRLKLVQKVNLISYHAYEKYLVDDSHCCGDSV